MKNIHILPTPNPSKFYSIDGKHKLTNSTIAMDWYISSLGYKPHNIFITSDEEIKEDYVIAYGVVIKVMMFEEETLYFVNGTKAKREDCKKITLTTDQDLIKDGVQAINDEFLEWFVKNPSCEEIIIEKKLRCCGRCDGVDDLCYTDMTCDYHTTRGCEICYGLRIDYKIIIPKEELKQESVVNEKCFTCSNSQYKMGRPFCTDDFCNKDFYEKPKQETLEEFAKNHLINNTDDFSFGYGSKFWYFAIDLIKTGAKWQQERSYSEEEVLAMFNFFTNEKTSKWIFEQFKKK